MSPIPPGPASARRARRRRGLPSVGLAVLSVLVLGAAVLAGCSSDGDDGSAGSTVPTDDTAVDQPGTTQAPPGGSTTSTGSTPSTTTEGSLPSSPSTIPADLVGTCAALAETYGIDVLRPSESGSWVDERQRVVVDARREADLLVAARAAAPPDLAEDLTTLADYATFVADAVAAAESQGAAVAAIDAGPPRGPVDAASAAVAAWSTANC
jgi:hypothetical protein